MLSEFFKLLRDQRVFTPTLGLISFFLIISLHFNGFFIGDKLRNIDKSIKDNTSRIEFVKELVKDSLPRIEENVKIHDKRIGMIENLFFKKSL